MINKEEIERAKWRVKHKNFYIQIKPSSVVCIDCISNNRNKHIEAEIDIDPNLDDAIETLLQYIAQLEKEKGKQDEETLEFEISEESKKELNKLFQPLRDAHNRFENGEETLEDLLNFYPNFRMLFIRDGKEIELNIVEKKYYEKLVNVIKKQNKIINEMAKAWKQDDCRSIEEIKKCFKKKVEEKGK